MNFKLNLKISQKLTGLLVGLLIAFATITTAYIVLINVESDVTSTQQQVGAYKDDVAVANVSTLTMRDLASRFTTLITLEAADAHAKGRNAVEERLKPLQQKPAEFEDGGILSKIDDTLAQYDSTFEQLRAAVVQFGLSENEGMRIIMRDAAHEIEDTLREYDEVRGLSSHLQMRRHEKDFIERVDEKYIGRMEGENANFKSIMLSSTLPKALAEKLVSQAENYTQAFKNGAQALLKVQELELKLFDLSDTLSQLFGQLNTAADQFAQQKFDASESNLLVTEFIFTAALILAAVGTSVGTYLIYRSIMNPLNRLQNTINQVNTGNDEVRTGLSGNDELNTLGKTFDRLLDERISTLQLQARENDSLNNSIISLIKSLGMIAKKDLSIKVPVSSDVTGTISDAVNLLTSETAQTLQQVKEVSDAVNKIVLELNSQSDKVLKVAEDERTQVIETGKVLEMSSRTMNAIAKDAESANVIANNAIETTQTALQTVTETVNGIKTIRETISETEKRIKRLGDRSQEITGIVNLINTIAERTHILALNASMHAASAGEAGKGFAVVAEEVQRLAQNAREATAEIASMVNNIRVETTDTVTTMNKLISQVADGTKLAEEAGQRMEETQQSTRKLVDTVRTISESSINQAKVAAHIKERALAIRKYTEETGSELAHQRRHTTDLTTFSKVLIDRVNVFTLPNIEGSTQPSTIAALRADSARDLRVLPSAGNA